MKKTKHFHERYVDYSPHMLLLSCKAELNIILQEIKTSFKQHRHDYVKQLQN